MDKQIELFEEKLHPECKRILAQWPKLKAAYKQDQFVTKIRDKELVTKLFSESLSGTRISKVAVPEYEDWGEILKWSLKENVPGEFPYTAGVFPFKREGEDPKRQFAGEGHQSGPTDVSTSFRKMTRRNGSVPLLTRLLFTEKTRITVRISTARSERAV